MQSQYNFKKVYHIVKRSIARNITIGEGLNQMLNEVPHELMNRVIDIVKQQYKMDDSNDQFASQKKNHILKTLDHILKRTYDFKTKNIMLALQLNQEYPQEKIEISPEDIPYQCSICQKRYFKQRQHLLTHEKSCVKKFNIESKEIFSQLSQLKGKFFEIEDEEKHQKKSDQKVILNSEVTNNFRNDSQVEGNKKQEIKRKDIIFEEFDSFEVFDQWFHEEKQQKR